MFQAAADLLLQFAKSAVGTDSAGRQLFTWWNQVPGNIQSPYNVIAGAINGPLKEYAKNARGYVQRQDGREVWDICRRPVDGCPFLPETHRPDYGHFFHAAWCLVGPDGLPVDDAGNLLTIPPKGAWKLNVQSAEVHMASGHWYVETVPANRA